MFNKSLFMKFPNISEHKYNDNIQIKLFSLYVFTLFSFAKSFT